MIMKREDNEQGHQLTRTGRQRLLCSRWISCPLFVATIPGLRQGKEQTTVIRATTSSGTSLSLCLSVCLSCIGDTGREVLLLLLLLLLLVVVVVCLTS